MILEDISDYSDTELFQLIAKYAVWYVEDGWEWAKVMWVAWAEGTSSMRRSASPENQQDFICMTLKQSTEAYKLDQNYASAAFKQLRERIKGADNEQWKKAVFTLYADGKFELGFDYDLVDYDPFSRNRSDFDISKKVQ